MPGTVLTLDYPGYEERARISDLVGSGSHPAVRPLMTNPLPRSPSAAAYARALVDGCGIDEPVQAVVSYCLASPIGHEVARLVTQRHGTAPVLVALDGSPCPTSTVDQTYREMVARFGGPDYPSTVRTTREDIVDRPADLLAAMTTELTRASIHGASEGPDDADDILLTLLRELVGKTVDWLAQLVAAHNAEFPQWPGRAVLIRSRDHPFDGPWPGAASSQTHHIECGREELLQHPLTRRAVSVAVGGTALEVAS